MSAHIRLSSDGHVCNVSNDNGFKIKSKLDGGTIRSISLDPVAIQTILGQAIPKDGGRCLPGVEYVMIQTEDSNPTSVKTYHIAKSELQGFIDSVEKKGEAVIDAAKKGTHRALEDLIANGPISDEDRGKALIYATNNKDVESIKVLLASGKITDRDRGMALICATGHKNIESVKVLLASGKITDEDRCHAVKKAPKGSSDCLEVLLASGKITEEVRGQSVLHAASAGDLEMLKLLVGGGKIPLDDRCYALSFAAAHKDTELIVVLLNESVPGAEPIGNEFLCSALVSTAQNGSTDSVKLLLSKAKRGASFETKLDQAIIEAAKNLHANTLRVLLDSTTNPDEARGKAVKHLAKHEKPANVALLFETGGISDRDLWDAIKGAASGGYAESIAVILKEFPLASASIWDGDRGEAVKILALRGYDQGIQILLGSGAISDQDRGEAVVFLTQGKKPASLEILLRSGSITEILRGRAVGNLVQKGDLVSLRLLLEGSLPGSGPISENDRCYATIEAGKINSRQILEFFLRKGPISQRMRGLAIIGMARYGRIDNARLLLQGGLPGSGSISEEDKQDAIGIARQYSQVSFESFLRSLPVACIGIDPTVFNEHPELYLAHVVKHGLQPVTFLFADGTKQAGLDIGGLSKQFISQLLEHLILQNVIERDDLRFPRSDKKDLAPYTQLGNLLSLLDEANQRRKDLLFIGEVFSPETYALLQFLVRSQDPLESPEVRKQAEFMQIANATVRSNTKVLVDFLNNQSPKKDAIEGVKAYIELIDMEKLPEEISLLELRDICFNRLKIKEYHDTLLAIIKGLSPALKDKILSLGAAMAKDVQGEINHSLLSKFKLSTGDEIVKQKLGWIIEKIEEDLATPEKTWTKKFLKCVTSQSVIPMVNIEVRKSSDTMCYSHTCFCQLDLPNDKTSKALFYERLELLLAEEGFRLK